MAEYYSRWEKIWFSKPFQLTVTSPCFLMIRILFWMITTVSFCLFIYYLWYPEIIHWWIDYIRHPTHMMLCLQVQKHFQEPQRTESFFGSLFKTSSCYDHTRMLKGCTEKKERDLNFYKYVMMWFLKLADPPSGSFKKLTSSNYWQISFWRT